MKRALLLVLFLMFAQIIAQNNSNKSLKFIGTSPEGVVINSSNSINSYGSTLQLTISAWIKLDSLNKTRTIVNKNRGNCADDFWFAVTQYNELKFGYNGGCQGDIQLGTQINYFELNKWYYVTVTMDGRVGQRVLKLFVEGNLVKSGAMANFNLAVNNIPFVIGNNRHWNGLNGLSFSGNISEVQYYNTALTETQIKDRMSRQLNLASADTTGLIGYWQLNGSGIDAYKYGNNGQVEGISQFVNEHPFLNNSNSSDTTTVWRMQLKSKISTLTDDQVFVGVADSATENFDSNYDIPKAPNPTGNYTSTYFSHPEWNSILGNRFAMDIKHNSDLADTVKRWYFEVETNVINDTVTLSFVNDRIPNSFGKYLTDLSNGTRINLKNISEYKYYNTLSTSRKFMLIIGDSTAPLLSNLKPNGSEIYRSSSNKTISWQSSDGTGIDSVFIYTSSNSGTNYSLLKQVGNIQATTWSVPNEYLNDNYSVKLVVRDSLGNQATIKSEKTFTVVGDSLATNSSAGWSLISLPLSPSDSLISKTLGDDINSNPFYVWSYSSNTGYTIPNSLKFKSGYWLGLLTGSNWDITGLAVEEDSTVQSLELGYNVIGNNFVRKISKGELSFIKDNQLYTYSAAITNGLITNTIYGYEASNYLTKDTLDLFKGYWLGVLQNNVQLIEKPSRSINVPSLRFQETKTTPTSWELPLVLSSESMIDKISTFGVRLEASNDFDVQYDAPRPPKSPDNNYLELFFEHEGGNYPGVLGKKYAKDFKAPGNTIWNFKIESSKNSELSLSWDKSKVAVLPDTIKLTLMDLSTGNSMNMKTDSSYTFTYNGIRSFSVNASITEINELNNVPKEFDLSQNYPNPFNPSTSIKYSVPFESSVKLVVFNTLGEIVKELVSEVKATGNYEVNFNASHLSSGIYFYSISAQPLNGGESFRAVKKLVLVK